MADIDRLNRLKERIEFFRDNRSIEELFDLLEKEISKEFSKNGDSAYLKHFQRLNINFEKNETTVPSNLISHSISHMIFQTS